MDWAIWRPVIAKLDTLTNVQEKWSFDDLCDAHEVLDIKEEMADHVQKRAKA